MTVAPSLCRFWADAMRHYVFSKLMYSTINFCQVVYNQHFIRFICLLPIPSQSCFCSGARILPLWPFQFFSTCFWSSLLSQTCSPCFVVFCQGHHLAPHAPLCLLNPLQIWLVPSLTCWLRISSLKSSRFLYLLLLWCPPGRFSRAFLPSLFYGLSTSFPWIFLLRCLLSGWTPGIFHTTCNIEVATFTFPVSYSPLPEMLYMNYLSFSPHVLDAECATAPPQYVMQPSLPDLSNPD